jgi:hypothetical protein
MSFTGDLEHLPIVDVIQLLHATRKSGILRIGCRKGESQLVFKDGYIVSANHLNNSVRIGKILIDLGLITPEILDQTLKEQKDAGSERKPLIISLIERGSVNERDAYKGLEQLIEMTVVEILTWKGGTFTLDVMPQSVADEYRYFPEKMGREINVDTQGILMNALRIFDEKMRDGQLQEEEFSEEEFTLEEYDPDEEGPILSADLLGLDEIDRLEDKLPEVYSALEDTESCDYHRRTLEKIAPYLSLPEREALGAFIADLSASPGRAGAATAYDEPALNVIFYSCDELVSHCVTAVCKDAGISVFTTNEVLDLDPVLERFLSDRLLPILVFDSPRDGEGGFSSEMISELRRRKREKYPQLCIIQFAPPRDAAFTMQAYGDNARAVIPRPSREECKEAFVADAIGFMQIFRKYVRSCGVECGSTDFGRLRNSFSALRGIRGAPEAAFLLLQFVADIFERCVTLIVREKEIVAEKGIGVIVEKGRGVTPSMGFRIPILEPSLFNEVIVEGRLFYGNTDDVTVRESLFAEIGAPERPSILLLPLRLQGKTISLTYGDFGGKEPAAVDLELLEILASHAELALENSLYRKKPENRTIKFEHTTY